MKTNLIFSFFSLLLAGFPGNAYAQQDSAINRLSAFIENVNTLSMYLPQEKVYLHTDNTGYYLGETIWFKAYVVNAELHASTNVSRTLYIELLAPEGETVISKKYEIKDGQCAGDIYLDTRSLYSGFYELRAYTRYMTNFDRENIFSRIIPVYSFPEQEGNYTAPAISGSRIRRTQYREIPPKQDDINIAFFPEGGNLIQGITSQVAFKATDREGKSIEINGTVYNSRKEETATFSSFHNGMGVFRFRPDSETCTAKITSGDRTKEVKLPVALPQGFVLTVNNLDEENLNIRIDKTPGKEEDPTGLAILVRGKVYHFMNLDFQEKDAVKLLIEKTEIPAGVAQVILFNTQGHILADRLAFVSKKEAYLTIQVQADKAAYAPFEKVNLDFDVRNSQGDPVETVFSLSVKDNATFLSPVNKDNLLINMLLSSDLKGLIEKPSYYFASDDRTHRYALDLLMLTQGWRRYKWEELSGQKPLQPEQKAEKGLIIDGTVQSILRKRPQTDMDIELIMTQRDSTGYYGENLLTGYCRTNKEGRFEFPLDTALQGRWEIVIQAKDKGKRKDNRIALSRFNPLPASYPAGATEFAPLSGSKIEWTDRSVLPEKEEEIIEEDIPLDDDSLSMTEKTHLLQEITVQAKRVNRKTEEKRSSSLIVYDVNEQRDKLIDSGDLEYDLVVDFLEATNPSFTVNRGGRTEGTDQGYYQYDSRPVMFLIDRKPIIDQAWKSVDDLSMSYIDKIVITTSPTGKPATVYDEFGEYTSEIEVDVRYLEKVPNLPASDCFRGEQLRSDIVYIFLHSKYGMKSIKPSKGVRNTQFDAYSVSREFYSPKYEYEASSKDKDYRRTLYWNPFVTTGKTGKAGVSFYNNASAAGFEVQAETITNEGKMGVYESQH